MTSKIRLTLLTGAVIASFSAQAIAQSTQPDFDALTKDVEAKIAVLKARVVEKPRSGTRKPTTQEELARLFDGRPDQPKLSPAEEKMLKLKGALEDIRQALANDRVAEATRTAQRYAKNRAIDDVYDANAGPREEWAALAEALSALSDAKLNQILQQSKDFLAAVPQKMKQAKAADELGTLDDALVTQLRQLANFSETPSASRQQGLINQYRTAIERYAQVLQAEAIGDNDRALQLAEDIIGFGRQEIFPGREAVQAKAAELRARFSGELAKVLKANAQAVAEAKSADDLNPVIRVLEEGRTANQNSTRSLTAYNAEWDAVTKYGKILDAERANKLVTAMELLNRELQPRADTDPKSVLVPRSLLEAKLAALQQAMIQQPPEQALNPTLRKLAEGFEAANTLPEFLKAADNADRILGLSFKGPQSTEEVAAAQRLRKTGERVRALAAMKAVVETGVWDQVWDQNKQMLARRRPGNEDSARLPWDAKLEKIRQDVLMSAVVGCDELKPLNLKPKPGERVDQLLMRHADNAAAAKNYPQTLMVLRTYALIVYGDDDTPPRPVTPAAPPANTGFRNPRPTPRASRNTSMPANLRDDLEGLSAFVQATHAEAAGDLETAVAGYRQALAMTGPHVPTDAATARLAALGSQHPDLLRPATPAPARTAMPTTRKAFRPSGGTP